MNKKIRSYKVKCNCVLLYGFYNHGSVTLNVGQIWEYISKPSEYFPFHTLKRQNVIIEVTNKDFEECFEPQKIGIVAL